MISLDLAARQVIMSAFLYYSMDSPVLSDREYDERGNRCVKEWDSLSPLRRWQFNSKEDLSATGYHIRITSAGVAGALTWAKQRGVYTKAPRFSKKHQVTYWNVGDFIPWQS